MQRVTFAQIRAMKQKFQHNPRAMKYLLTLEKQKLEGIRDKNVPLKVA